LLLLVAASGNCLAQSETGDVCRDDITAFDGYKFRSVKVRARFVPALPTPLPPAGTTYSPATVTRIVEDVHAVLTKEANREGEAGETEQALLRTVTIGANHGAAVGVKIVTSCTKVVEPAECENDLGKGNSKCVDVAVHAFSWRVNTANPLANLLNIPRSNRPSFLSNVPGPLLALNPKFGLEHDVKYGPTATLALSANLLDVQRNLRSLPLNARRTRLDFDARARRSLNGPYYNLASKLSLSRSFANSISEVALDAGFIADRDSRGENTYLRNAAAVGGTVKLRTNFEPLADISVAGHYRYSSNRLTRPAPLPAEFTSEQSFAGGAVFTGRLWRGVSRLGLWLDANSPGGGRDNYHRAAALWGFQREFLTAPNQTIGVEALMGVGRAWGSVPQYARFYGGNSATDFIYDTVDSPVWRSFPVGPILRSAGSAHITARDGAGATGGTSYWNLNLSVSIPVPRWSSPIVPDISLSLPTRDANGRAALDANGDPIMEERPLRLILKNQGENSQKILERVFRKEGLTPEAAQDKARRELKSINAILGFIADQANIYSVKPLVLFDAARLNTPGLVGGQTRYAVGGGLQLTVVIAKFEAGYMRAIRRAPGDDKGNFIMRLYFQNLF
jgi:hypothetical protein